MWETIEWLDEKILSFFTKVSHRFQILTGRTNYFLAKICMFVAGAGATLQILNYFHQILAHRTPLFLVVVYVGVIGYAVYRTLECDTFENDVLNRERISVDIFSAEVALRVFFAFFTILSVPVVINEIFSARGILQTLLEIVDAFYVPSVFAYWYLMSVTPLPPAQGKIKE